MSDLKHLIHSTADQACQSFAERAGDSLDYSQASLAMIDEMMDEFAAMAADMPVDARQGLVQIMGCYTMAVADKTFEGEFLWDERSEQPVFVVGEPEYHIAFKSFDKIAARLVGNVDSKVQTLFNEFAEKCRSAETGDKFEFA